MSALAAEGGVSWTQLDRALPLPLSFEDGETELAQKAGADLESLDQEPLVVTGLAPGRFELEVDGQSVGTFTDAQLAKGVNLALYRTPMRWQAYAVKWSVGGGHEEQRVRRELMVASAKDPSLRAPADTLAARDESQQKERSADAMPKARRYELIRRSQHPRGVWGDGVPPVQRKPDEAVGSCRPDSPAPSLFTDPSVSPAPSPFTESTSSYSATPVASSRAPPSAASCPPFPSRFAAGRPHARTSAAP